MQDRDVEMRIYTNEITVRIGIKIVNITITIIIVIMTIIITITRTMKDVFICNRNPVFISKKQAIAIFVVK